MRQFNTSIIIPVMKLTGFRFSKSFRRGDTLAHRVVYRMISTVEANIKADRKSKVIFPLLIVIALFTLGSAVGETPVENCTADYCISEGETIEQLGL